MIFLLSGRWASYALWGFGFLGWFWAVLGRYCGGQNWKRIFEKTGVGFGRTELSLRAIGTTFGALLFGHGPKGGLGFQGGSSGVDFNVILGAVLGGSKVTNFEKYF